MGQILQVLLRAVQFTALSKAARRRGIASMIRYMMRTAARTERAGGRLCVRIAMTNYRMHWLYAAKLNLVARAPPRPLAA